jgi:glutathione S-transferase
VGLWTDRSFFQNTVNLIFGTLGDKVPQDYIEDRGRLRGAKFDIEAMRAAIPQMRDQFRAHTGWIEAQLRDGRQWLLGTFSLADFNAYQAAEKVAASEISGSIDPISYPRRTAYRSIDNAYPAEPSSPKCSDTSSVRR